MGQTRMVQKNVSIISEKEGTKRCEELDSEVTECI